jgi:hypothetical protein
MKHALSSFKKIVVLFVLSECVLSLGDGFVTSLVDGVALFGGILRLSGELVKRGFELIALGNQSRVGLTGLGGSFNGYLSCSS